MGSVLVMAVVPSETIGWSPRQQRARAALTGEAPLPPGVVRLELPVDEVAWRPPPEPTAPDWHRDPELRRAHLARVRASLEAFLAGHVARLGGGVRTGWFILGDVGVRVTRCREARVPDLARLGRSPAPPRAAPRRGRPRRRPSRER